MKLGKIAVMALLSFVMLACGTGSEADVDFDIDADMTTFTWDDADSCATDVSAGNGDSSDNCGATLSFVATAEEKSGSCKATDVTVKWTFEFSNNTSQQVEIDFGDIDRGDSESETVSIHFSNWLLFSDGDPDGDASFGSDCGGTITGLDGIPI